MKWAIDRRGIRLILEISGGKENPQLTFYGNNGKAGIETNASGNRVHKIISSLKKRR